MYLWALSCVTSDLDLYLLSDFTLFKSESFHTFASLPTMPEICPFTRRPRSKSANMHLKEGWHSCHALGLQPASSPDQHWGQLSQGNCTALTLTPWRGCFLCSVWNPGHYFAAYSWRQNNTHIHTRFFKTLKTNTDCPYSDYTYILTINSETAA